MSKIAVVFWSGTGNTEAMANIIADAAKAAGAEADVIFCADFNNTMVGNYTALALGCPSMGAEELEDGEFAPMYDSISGNLNGKKVGLFGSYGWGDGEWMRNFKDDVAGNGATVINDIVICCGYPEGDVVDELKSLGQALANA